MARRPPVRRPPEARLMLTADELAELESREHQTRLRKLREDHRSEFRDLMVLHARELQETRLRHAEELRALDLERPVRLSGGSARRRSTR